MSPLVAAAPAAQNSTRQSQLIRSKFRNPSTSQPHLLRHIKADVGGHGRLALAQHGRRLAPVGVSIAWPPQHLHPGGGCGLLAVLVAGIEHGAAGLAAAAAAAVAMTFASAGHLAGMMPAAV